MPSRAPGPSRSSAAASGATAVATSTPRCSASGGTDEVVVLPSAAAYEHPERVGERAARVLRATRREGPGAARAAPRRGRGAQARRDRARGALRLHRRRLAAAPALGAEGLRPLRIRARRVPRRRGRSPRRVPGRRCCATRWSIRAAVRTPSASAWSPTSPSSRTTAPRPTTCASAPSTCCPRGDAGRRRRGDRADPRPDGTWQRRGRGEGDRVREPRRHATRSGTRPVTHRLWVAAETVLRSAGYGAPVTGLRWSRSRRAPSWWWRRRSASWSRS